MLDEWEQIVTRLFEGIIISSLGWGLHSACDAVLLGWLGMRALA